MKCDTYRATIPASLCLLYQDYAAGNITLKNNFSRAGESASKKLIQIKYQPCLTCETGKEVKANGGKDMDRDVEALKAARSLSQSPDCTIGQICKVCGVPKNFSEFYEVVAGSGKYVKECKDCTKKQVAEQATAKRQAKLASRNIDQNAPVNISVPETRTCTRCGYQGPDDDFHRAGITGIIKFCRKCVAEQRQANNEAKKTRAQEVPPGCVILNFSEYPELLIKIAADAKKNCRTVSNEILFRVVNYEKYSN